ncbi:alpha-L-arabinofuranosidase C-terminal domain-containing protein [Acidisarcina polymorpha]|nr:alpha-L-arabinofuranosidase C-terminal domain-containing protein [Acidisarcina polymorpha]
MNRRQFFLTSLAAAAAGPLGAAETPLLTLDDRGSSGKPQVTVLVVDTDRVSTPISDGIYGQFLEHINHSIEDGLFAEQIRGAGFEGEDFKTYWLPFADHGEVELADVAFNNGIRCVRLRIAGGHAGVRQGRVFLEENVRYDGWVWMKLESGSPDIELRVTGPDGKAMAMQPLKITGSDWQEVPFSFTSFRREEQASVEIVANGKGTLLLDFVSLMRADARRDGKLRPDLFQSLQGLHPSFVRWPGGSYASTYKWKECIGPYASRGYHPNMYWGGYSGYGGFGTDEFLGLCSKLKCEPLIVLACPDTKPESVQYAMDWVRYLNGAPTSEMGRLRAANGHAEPYGVKLFQIDNEPMNNGFTPEQYAEIVNLYGTEIRKLVSEARIVACGQKRSSDMDWSEKVVDLAGDNFDILGCHNYEYEPENYQSGLPRLQNYLTKLIDYVRASKHPHIEVAALEWSLQHTYDWRAGLHAAGSLIMYEELGPGLTMTCPALLMRNTTDDPKWTSSIYHNHVTWFPGGSYPVERLFREHYAERYLASAMGSFEDVPDRSQLFDKISTAIPSGWTEGAMDAIATASADGMRVVIKTVNYGPRRNTLLVHLQGQNLPERAKAKLYTIAAPVNATASFDRPDIFTPLTKSIPYAKNFSVDVDPYSVAVVEIQAE